MEINKSRASAISAICFITTLALLSCEPSNAAGSADDTTLTDTSARYSDRQTSVGLCSTLMRSSSGG